MKINYLYDTDYSHYYKNNAHKSNCCILFITYNYFCQLPKFLPYLLYIVF